MDINFDALLASAARQLETPIDFFREYIVAPGPGPHVNDPPEVYAVTTPADIAALHDSEHIALVNGVKADLGKAGVVIGVSAVAALGLMLLFGGHKK